jgi:hypothetical protein
MRDCIVQQAGNEGAATNNHRLELGTVCSSQAQRLDQLRHRVASWDGAFATLQPADAAGTDAGPFGQLFLGHSGRPPVGAQGIAEPDWF